MVLDEDKAALVLVREVICDPAGAWVDGASGVVLRCSYCAARWGKAIDCDAMHGHVAQKRNCGEKGVCVRYSREEWGNISRHNCDANNDHFSQGENGHYFLYDAKS